MDMNYLSPQKEKHLFFLEKLICRRLYFKRLCYYTLITHCLPAMMLWENCQFKNNEVTVQVHYSYAHLPYKMAVYKK